MITHSSILNVLKLNCILVLSTFFIFLRLIYFVSMESQASVYILSTPISAVPVANQTYIKRLVSCAISIYIDCLMLINCLLNLSTLGFLMSFFYWFWLRLSFFRMKLKTMDKNGKHLIFIPHWQMVGLMIIPYMTPIMLLPKLVQLKIVLFMNLQTHLGNW